MKNRLNAVYESEVYQDQLDLSKFNNSWYSPGRSKLVQAAWFFVGSPLLRCAIISSPAFRSLLLRMFGCQIGCGVKIKPGVRVKYPWLLKIGNHTWLGEDCWIDNLAQVTIGANACLSQSSYVCTGNHDWTDPTFGLIVKPIAIGDGVWVGANVTVLPGAILGNNCVVTAGSTVSGILATSTIYQGNPAIPLKQRTIKPAKVY